MNTFDTLIHFRKELHSFPKVSGDEAETVERIQRFLKEHGIFAVREVGRHGLAVSFTGENPGKEVWIRGDTDALPIQETASIPHRSKYHGAAHMCGHDGHTTILLALALRLQEDPPKSGMVLLLFQPAEENGEGAKSMLADPFLVDRRPDFVFALHNLPGYPLHQIVLKEGTFNCAVKSIAFELQGKTAHAAEPEHGKNPANTIARIFDLAEKWNNPDLEDPQFLLFTPVYSRMGSKEYGISAGEGEVHFTIRSFSSPFLKERMEGFAKAVETLASEHGLKVKTSIFQEFEACLNDPSAIALLDSVVSELNLNKTFRDKPMKWGEDFGLFTQQYPGAMFGIGAGEEVAALHNPDYDFPDAIIPTAASVFEGVIRKLNS